MQQLIQYPVFVLVYFILNGIIAGFYVGRNLQPCGRWGFFIFLIITLSTGIIFYLLSAIWRLLDRLQVIFFFKFYLTKTFNDLDRAKLEKLRKRINNIKDKTEWRYRLYRHCGKMVLRRNNCSF